MSEKNDETFESSINDELTEIKNKLKEDAPDVFNNIFIGAVKTSLIMTTNDRNSSVSDSIYYALGVIAGAGTVAGFTAFVSKFFQKGKRAKEIATVNQSITKCHDILNKQQGNAEFITEELAKVQALIDKLDIEKKKLESNE